MSVKKDKANPSENQSKLRRRLLTGGVAAGVTAPFIPSSWTRPLVESVLLPAHAQTSPDDEGCRDDVFPGCEICCTAGTGSQSTALVRLVEDCIEVTSDDVPTFVEPPEGEIRVACTTSVDEGDIGVAVWVVGQSPLNVRGASRECEGGIILDDSDLPPLTVTIGGRAFELRFSFAINSNCVASSPIEFVRV